MRKCICICIYSLVAQMVKRLPTMQETQVQSLSQEDPLEKGMATHSSVHAWKSHGPRSLVGYSPGAHKESDTSLSLSLYVYIYIYIYIYVHYIYMQMCISMCILICICICLYICIFVYVYQCVYVHCCHCLVTKWCLTLCNPMDCSLPGFSVHKDFPGKSPEVGGHCLLQGIFRTQGSNLWLLSHLMHWRQILYCWAIEGTCIGVHIYIQKYER